MRGEPAAGGERMSAVLAERVRALPHAGACDTALVLLGTGVVGGAFLKLLDAPAATTLRLVGAANSRRQSTDPARLAERRLRERLRIEGDARDDATLLDALDASGAARRVIVDATASDEIAARHAVWLRAGYHVVTANKAAIGDGLAAWNALASARHAGGAGYGDAATVGAGLPILSSVRRLAACGDRVLAIEGVFSGSLSWLFGRYDGTQPFSRLLAEARARGYTEPDPRTDLSGADVARKLLVLARSAGFALEAHDVVVDDLVPSHLRDCPLEEFLSRAHELDAPLAARHAEAVATGSVLRHLARFSSGGLAEVGLRQVPGDHPAAHLGGTDNLFALTTTRYRERPLVIQGPGAGAEVTAQALLGDVLALASPGA
jgi:aspartokinase/homoserine dehydrogenase 1